MGCWCVQAAPEDLKATPSRGFDPAQFRELLNCSWAHHGWNILISGETGTGKTWMACCIGTAAIRQSLKTKYYRVDDLLYEMALMRADGQLLKFKTKLTKYQLLILDDFGVTPMTQQSKSDLLEVMDDRVEPNQRSLSVKGHTMIGIRLLTIPSLQTPSWIDCQAIAGTSS